MKLARGGKDEEHAHVSDTQYVTAIIGIDIGKNSFHIVVHDKRGAIVLRQKWSRGHSLLRLSANRYRFGLSETDFRAFRTSASDNPNCRVIREGVTPALNAARTAFT